MNLNPIYQALNKLKTREEQIQYLKDRGYSEEAAVTWINDNEIRASKYSKKDETPFRETAFFKSLPERIRKMREKGREPKLHH